MAVTKVGHRTGSVCSEESRGVHAKESPAMADAIKGIFVYDRSSLMVQHILPQSSSFIPRPPLPVIFVLGVASYPQHPINSSKQSPSSIPYLSPHFFYFVFEVANTISKK